MQRRFVFYLLAIAFNSLATGIQLVVLPWLATGQLNLPAGQVGWVQSAQLIPGAVLMLWSGSLADRNNSERFLPWYYLLTFGCHVAMLWLIQTGLLMLSWLLLYGVMLGTVFTFLQPLRDRFLPTLVEPGGNALQRSIVLVGMCTYMGQALGVAVAGQMDNLGLVFVYAVQCSCLALAAISLGYVLKCQRSLEQKTLTVHRPNPSQPSIWKGLIYVFHHRVLRHLIILVSFNGFMNLGVYLVALPLLARDVYLESAAFFSALQFAFVIGNVAATIGLLKRGHVDAPGRSVLFCLLYSAVLMLAIAAQPTSTGLLLLVFFWGVIAGVSSNMGKALLQQQVKNEYRGRVLSIYFLALLGSAPLGALFCGYVMDIWSAELLFKLAGSMSLLLFVVYMRLPSLWHRETT